jgi:hypothetical protein
MVIQISQDTFNFLTEELPEFNMESLSRLAKLGEKQEQPEFTENVNEENSIPTVSDAPQLLLSHLSPISIILQTLELFQSSSVKTPIRRQRYHSRSCSRKGRASDN